MIKLALIGAGLRTAALLPILLQLDDDVVLTAVADPDEPGARHRLTSINIPINQTRFVPSVDVLLEQANEFDAIMIGTRCDTHAPLAVKIAALSVPVYLEKPVGINAEQIQQLHAAYAGREEKVVVSFPLRLSTLFQRVLEVVRSGRLGPINQVQAVNYVPYGGVYFGLQWYRDYATTGGLWLQKATHDFDYINQLVAAAPLGIAAMSTRAVYGGDLPADLTCSQCDRTDSCIESPANIAKREDDGGMQIDLEQTLVSMKLAEPKDNGQPSGGHDHWCAFSESIRNQDAGSALIHYANGTHAAYSQNFITRRSAAARGARITGHAGTLEFDWHTETMKITEHHGKKVEQEKVSSDEGHHGGDHALLKNFLDVIRNGAVSLSPLDAGILSCSMCLAARASAATHSFKPVAMPGQTSAPPLPKPDPTLEPVLAHDG